MLDFTEQAPSTEFPPVSSVDTPTVSGNLQGTEVAADSLLATEIDLEATKKILAPYHSSDKLVNTVFYQDEDEDGDVPSSH